MTDQPAGCPGAAELIARIDAAVTLPDVGAITARVKADLEDLLGRGALRLPEALVAPRADTYARRLLHQDPDGRYTAVVMTWGPGQATAVHDHGGLWCVEGVVSGEMVVTQYDVHLPRRRHGNSGAGCGAARRHRLGGAVDSAHRLPRARQRPP